MTFGAGGVLGGKRKIRRKKTGRESRTKMGGLGCGTMVSLIWTEQLLLVQHSHMK